MGAVEPNVEWVQEPLRADRHKSLPRRLGRHCCAGAVKKTDYKARDLGAQESTLQVRRNTFAFNQWLLNVFERRGTPHMCRLQA